MSWILFGCVVKSFSKVVSFYVFSCCFRGSWVFQATGRTRWGGYGLKIFFQEANLQRKTTTVGSRILPRSWGRCIEVVFQFPYSGYIGSNLDSSPIQSMIGMRSLKVVARPRMINGQFWEGMQRGKYHMGLIQLIIVISLSSCVGALRTVGTDQ